MRSHWTLNIHIKVFSMPFDWIRQLDKHCCVLIFDYKRDDVTLMLSPQISNTLCLSEYYDLEEVGRRCVDLTNKCLSCINIQ